MPVMNFETGFLLGILFGAIWGVLVMLAVRRMRRTLSRWGCDRGLEPLPCGECDRPLGDGPLGILQEYEGHELSSVLARATRLAQRNGFSKKEGKKSNL